MEIKTLLKDLLSWFMTSYQSSSSGNITREWCDLGLAKPLTQSNIEEHFDRSDLNDKYKEQYTGSTINTKEPYAYTQVEINMIAGMHRTFCARHKTRLQTYRDDCANKHYHVRSSIKQGYGKFLSAKERVEDKT